MKQDAPCEMCEGRPPQLNIDNLKFMRVWNLISNSFFYVSTMDAVIPTGINWANVEAVFRLNHIKASRALIRRIRIAEQLTIERANATNNEVKNNGK